MHDPGAVTTLLLDSPLFTHCAKKLSTCRRAAMEFRGNPATLRTTSNSSAAPVMVASPTRNNLPTGVTWGCV